MFCFLGFHTFKGLYNLPENSFTGKKICIKCGGLYKESYYTSKYDGYYKVKSTRIGIVSKEEMKALDEQQKESRAKSI